MIKEKIGIIGWGIVGHALSEGFKGHELHIYDKNKETESLEDVVKKSDFIFLCVPTPMKKGKIDLSFLDEDLAQIVNYTDNTNKIVIIKSTVVSGTTASYQARYPNTRFVSNPEFLREASYIDDFKFPDRIVIGTDNEAAGKRVENLYRKRFPDCPIVITHPTSAELAKEMSNSLLATIVIFNNMIFDMCTALNIDYNEVAKIVALDRRYQNVDYFTISKERGFGGKCLPKDLNELANKAKELGVDSGFLEKVWSENLRIRKIHDWENIPFVQTA